MDYVISSLSDEESLMHYGVKGMKWGVRRRGENGSGLTQKKKRIP